MKFKKGKGKKIITGALLVSTIVGGTMYYNHCQNEEVLNIVKNGTSKINEEINYEQAFTKYITNCSFITYKDSEKNQIVSIQGKRYLRDKDRIADVEINYIVDRDNGTFKFYKGYIDKMEMNEIDVLIMTIGAFSTYDAVSNF